MAEQEQTIIISDLLSFISCKISILSKDNLLKCLQNFYSEEEASEALKTYLSSLPSQKENKYKKKFNEGDPFLVLYNIFKSSALSIKNSPIFVCKDLNNIPKIDSEESSNFDQEHKDLVNEQQLIKSQITEISNVVYQLKDQIKLLAKCERSETATKAKGLAYLQKLIDEEEEEKEKGLRTSIMREEMFDDLSPSDFEEDESNEDEQTLDLRANRMQRAFAKNTEKRSHKGKNENNEIGLVDSDANMRDADPLLEQKVILIKEEIEDPSDKDAAFPSNFNESEEEDENREIPKDGYKDECSLSPEADFDEEKYPNILVEQVFDEHVGHFSIYKCCLCDFSTNDMAAVELHDCPQIYMEDPNEEQSSSKQYNYFCLHCRFKCNTQLLFKRHTQIHPQSYPCPFCDEKLVESDAWMRHVHVCVKAGDRNPNSHICQICGIVYANAGALLVHKGFHDSAKPFECLKCRYRFYTQETLNRHFNSHLIKGFKCPFCIFVNKNKTTLSTHIRCHTGEMPFACHFCDYRSSSQSALTSHSFSHSNKKTIKCDECPSLFKTLHKLKAHKISHTKNRIHQCPACGKRFKTGSLMKIHHQRIHLNLRPHACDQCPYKARNSTALRDHMNAHSNEKALKCFECDFRANQKGYLRRHINLWHRGLKKKKNIN